MSSKNQRKIASVCLLFFIASSVILQNSLQLTHGQNGATQQSAWTLDLFAQFADGTNQNYLSSSFAPFEEVQLCGKVMYNNDSRSAISVAFQIEGPANSSNPLMFFRSAITNQSGIATVSFRIPLSNQSQDSLLGIWQVFASAATFPESTKTNMTFEVKWPVRIENISFLNSEGQEQLKFARENVTMNILLRNNAQQQREMNVTLDIADSSGREIGQVRIPLTLNSNDTEILIKREFEIPVEAALGSATVECKVTSGRYQEMEIPIAEPKSASFIIISRDLAIIEGYLSLDIPLGDWLNVTMTAANKGSETENLQIQIRDERVLRGNLTMPMEPMTSAQLNYILNISNWEEGIHTLTVSVTKLQGETNVDDNQVIAGAVTINYPPVNPQTTSMFLLLLVITGLFTSSVLFMFLRKKRNLRASIAQS